MNQLLREMRSYINVWYNCIKKIKTLSQGKKDGPTKHSLYIKYLINNLISDRIKYLQDNSCLNLFLQLYVDVTVYFSVTNVTFLLSVKATSIQKLIRKQFKIRKSTVGLTMLEPSKVAKLCYVRLRLQLCWNPAQLWSVRCRSNCF